MKTRTGFVSNSSSSSFLVPFNVSEKGIACVKLSKEIVDCLNRNLFDYDGKKVDLSKSQDWWLTEMVSDCDSARYDFLDKEAIQYLEGNNAPYGWYDEDGEERYIQLKGHSPYDDFFIAVGDLIGCPPQNELPEAFQMRSRINEILKCKALNKTEKLKAIKHYINLI